MFRFLVKLSVFIVLVAGIQSGNTYVLSQNTQYTGMILDSVNSSSSGSVLLEHLKRQWLPGFSMGLCFVLFFGFFTNDLKKVYRKITGEDL